MEAPACRTNTLEQLIEYAKLGSADKVQYILEHNPNAKKKLNKIFKAAVEAGNVAIIILLLEHGLSENNAIDIAVNSGNATAIHLVIDRVLKINPNVITENHLTKLIQAGEKVGRDDTILSLLKRGLSGNTALVIALNSGKKGFINSVLDQCLKIYSDFKTKKYLMNLYKAAIATDREDIIRLLLKNGLNVNAALDIAINSDNNKSIDLLLKLGADKDERLYCAVKANKLSTITVLLEGGANINTRRTNGNTLFHVAVLHKCDVEIVKHLLKKGLDPNLKNKDGNTALNLVEYRMRQNYGDVTIKENLEKIANILRPNALREISFECLQGLPGGLSGYSYQIKLFTLYAVFNTKLAVSRDIQYELGTEVKDLLPFDDITSKITEGGQTKSHFVQVKQTQKAESESLCESNFFTFPNCGKKFKGNIMKMFKKYNEIADSSLGKGVSVEFIYCTNKRFQSNSSSCFTYVNIEKDDLLCGIGRVKLQIQDWRYLFIEIKYVLLNRIGTSQYSTIMDKEFQEKFNAQMDIIDNINKHVDTEMLWSVGTIAEEGLKGIRKYLEYLESIKITIESASNVECVKKYFPDECELPPSAGNFSIFKNNAINKIKKYIKTVKSDLQLFSHFNNYDDIIIRNKIEHFTKHFSVYTDCPSSDELDAIITKEISEALNSHNSKLLSYYCLQYFSKIISNFRNECGFFFTQAHGKRLFQELRELMCKFSNNCYMEELLSYNIHFKTYDSNPLFKRNKKKLLDFFNNGNSNRVLHVVTEYARLHAICILQTLKGNSIIAENFNYLDSILFTSSERIFKSDDTVYNVLNGFSTNGVNDFLIIEFQDDFTELRKVYSLLANLENIMNENEKKKIIVIANVNNPLVTELTKTFEKHDSFRNSVSFQDLEPKSQDIILKRPTNFLNFSNSPGKEKAFRDFLTISSACHIIDEQILSTIISTKYSIKVGNNRAFYSDEYNTEYYISRRVQHQLIDHSILTQSDGQLFFVTGISKNQLMSKFNVHCNLINFWEEGKQYEKGIILMPIMRNNKTKYTSQEIFTRICNKYCQNINWLEFRDELAFWKGTNTTICESFCIEKVPEMNETMLEKFSFPPESLDQNIIILANNPGEGKSTMLTDLAHALKNKHDEGNDLWIIRINLKDHVDNKLTTSLNNITFGHEDTPEAVDTITRMVVQGDVTNWNVKLERKLLEAALSGHGKIKVVLLFDGYDEISPDYKKNTCILLKALKKSDVKQIWVTTRAHMKHYLEEELKTPACILTPLIKNQQVEFLSKFWKWHLKMFKDAKGANLREDEICANIINCLRMCYDSYYTHTGTAHGLESLIGIINKHEKSSLETLRNAIDDELDLSYCAETLIKEWGNSIRDEDGFSKVPLNLKMLAENMIPRIWVHDENKWQISNIRNIGTFEIYQEFVENKFKTYYEKKTSQSGNPAERDLAHFASPTVRKMHHELAVNTLFPTHSPLLPDLNIINKYEDMYEKLARIGLVKSYGNRVEFVHRSYADYFFSEYLSMHLENEKVQSEFLARILIEYNYQLVRTFFDGFLRESKLSLNFNKRQGAKSMLTPNVCREIVMKNLFFIEDNVLHIAARHGHTQIMLFIFNHVKIEDYIDLLTTESNGGNTVLHLAASNGHSNVCDVIFKTCKDHPKDMKNLITKSNTHNCTALHLAASDACGAERCDIIITAAKLHSDVFKQLIMQCDDKTQTVLHKAASSHDSNIFELIVYALPVNEHPNIFKDLIKMCDKYGQTALHIAALNNDSNVCEVILKKVQEYPQLYEDLIKIYDNKNQSILHNVALSGHSKACGLILESAIVDPGSWKILIKNKCNAFNRTALHTAAFHGHSAVCCVIMESAKKYENVLKYLIMTTDSTYSTHGGNSTALHLGAFKGYSEVCGVITKSLENHSCFLKDLLMKCDVHNQTALHIAARHDSKICQIIIDSLPKKEYPDIFKDLIRTCDKRRRTALHIAALNSDRQVCDIIMKNVLEDPYLFRHLMKIYDYDKQTIFHCAALNGHEEMCEAIINNANNNIEALNDYLNTYDELKRTPLQIAAFYGCSGVCDIILKTVQKFPDLLKFVIRERRNDAGRNALHFTTLNREINSACDVILKYVKGYPEVANDIIMAYDISRQTVLHMAARCDSKMCYSIIEALPTKEYSNIFKDLIKMCDQYGQTALHIAALNDESRVCEVILKKVIEYPQLIEAVVMIYDNKKRSILHNAALSGNIKACSIIMESTEVDPDILNILIKQCDDFKRTALHIAALYGHAEVCDVIMKTAKKYPNCFEDVVRHCDDNNQTALHLAAWKGHSEVCDVINKTVKDYSNVFIDLIKKCDNDSRTALHIAAWNGHSEVCSAIITKYEDLFNNLIYFVDVTAPHNARSNDSEVSGVNVISAEEYADLCKYLITKCDKDERTALHLAAREGHGEVCDYIINRIAKEDEDVFKDLIRKCDRHKRTALHIAARSGHSEVCEVIIESAKYYPDVCKYLITKCDKDERTALHLAKMNCHKKLCELIVETERECSDVMMSDQMTK